VLTAPPRVDSAADELRVLVVTNIYPSGRDPSEGTFVASQVESLRAAGIDVRLLYLPRMHEGRRVYRGLADRTCRLVRKHNADIVHVMYGGVMAEAVTRGVRSVPVVVSFCGTDLLGGRGRGPVHELSRRYGVVASRRAAVRAAAVVVKSQNLVTALPRHVDRSRVWVVPNGVELELFRELDRDACRVELGWDEASHHVLFPASPRRPEKGFDLAERAVALVRSRGTRVELHALEGVPHQAMPTWLNAADAVVLTSAHEGSPNAVKEALACNVPVVAVDVGDVRTRLEPIPGCEVSERRPDDVAVKLARVLERGGRVAGREHVADLALDRVAARIHDVYVSVAARAPLVAAR
jgi:teichuronic acid biosynthesis glycosyltransferase TuaC